MFCFKPELRHSLTLHPRNLSKGHAEVSVSLKMLRMLEQNAPHPALQDFISVVLKKRRLNGRKLGRVYVFLPSLKVKRKEVVGGGRVKNNASF